MSAARILVVDDETKQLTATKRILQRSGFTVDTASSGRHALRVALRCPPDLILADISMPKMSGQEFLRRFRRLERLGRIKRGDIVETPVIFVSALSAHSQRVGGLDAGAVDYITKPFDAEELRARVRQHLRHSTQMRQLLAGARLELLRLDTAMSGIQLQLEHCRQPLNDLETFLESNDAARGPYSRRELLSKALQHARRLADALDHPSEPDIPKKDPHDEQSDE